MKQKEWRLENKTALITGSTYGIGFSIASEMAKLGANIIIVSRNEKNVKQSTSKLLDFGNKVSGFVADISNPVQRE